MKTPFSENEATWNVSASGVNWQMPGANGENDRELTPIGSTAVLDDEATGTEKIIPLDASKMQELANGTFANNGFFLKTDAELNDAFFYKSSDSSAVTQRPKLVIEYTLSDSTPAPTFTPTLEISPTPTLTFTPSATPRPSVPLFASAAFTYDGDGKRVKSVLTTNLGSTTAFFIGNYYEVTGSTITKYYYAGTQQIAIPQGDKMRKNGTLNFILTDHLGSTSLVTDSTGAVINETKYKAWGEVRYSSGAEQTKYTYTGQYSYTSDFGLMFYNARWYDSSLGRFTQADSIIPAGVQGYDRYAYVNNAPVNLTDPSGHMVSDGLNGEGGGCDRLCLDNLGSRDGEASDRDEENPISMRLKDEQPVIISPSGYVLYGTCSTSGLLGTNYEHYSGCSSDTIYTLSWYQSYSSFEKFLHALSTPGYSLPDNLRAGLENGVGSVLPLETNPFAAIYFASNQAFDNNYDAIYRTVKDFNSNVILRNGDIYQDVEIHIVSGLWNTPNPNRIGGSQDGTVWIYSSTGNYTGRAVGFPGSMADNIEEILLSIVGN